MPIAFDAFGTLFDLEALREPAGDDLYEAFYARLQPWTWLATAAGAYRPLPELAEQAFSAAAAEIGADVDAGQLAGQLTELPLFPEARATLAALEDELADPKAWATKYETAKSTARHTAAKRAVEEAYEALEAFEAKV